MKIKMITRAQGPTVNMEPDKEYDVALELAKELVAAGCATCEEDLFPKPQKQVKETADNKAKKETANKT